MTEAPRPIVVHTSVAVKFYLPEEYMEDARKLRDAVDEGIADMTAPSTIQPEFWNALWQKRRRNELSPEETRSIWDEFAEDLTPRATETADFDIIIYDALFISLTGAMNTIVATADDRLLRALKQTPLVAPAM